MVHGLRCGLAVCGFPGLPVDWPPDHRWVYTHQPTHITCKNCRVELGLTLAPGEAVNSLVEPERKEPKPKPSGDYPERSA